MTRDSKTGSQQLVEVVGRAVSMIVGVLVLWAFLTLWPIIERVNRVHQWWCERRE